MLKRVDEGRGGKMEQSGGMGLWEGWVRLRMRERDVKSLSFWKKSNHNHLNFSPAPPYIFSTNKPEKYPRSQPGGG